MQISARVEYACLAVMDLAENYLEPSGTAKPVQVRKIAQKHGIPSKFLVQILLQLKRAGLVSSTRGAMGGYELLRAPSEITLADVMAVIEGSQVAVTRSAQNTTPGGRVLTVAWEEAAAAEQERLSAVTFADLVEEAHAQPAEMYYI
ncbi:MAG: Rrf2 family transcriptional regulator [Pirellulaceae bacterium]|nr:Rrf2 family transcriptional regulator [Pirellulaceae bacterium]